MKKYLSLILLISLSCSKKNDEDVEKSIYTIRLAILNEHLNKPAPFSIYRNYQDPNTTMVTRTLGDSTDKNKSS